MNFFSYFCVLNIRKYFVLDGLLYWLTELQPFQDPSLVKITTSSQREWGTLTVHRTCSQTPFRTKNISFLDKPPLKPNQLDFSLSLNFVTISPNDDELEANTPASGGHYWSYKRNREVHCNSHVETR